MSRSQEAVELAVAYTKAIFSVLIFCENTIKDCNDLAGVMRLASSSASTSFLTMELCFGAIQRAFEYIGVSLVNMRM